MNQISKILIALFVILSFVSCSENPQEPDKQYPLILKSFTPESGCIGSSIIIYGQHFVTDSVKFISINGKQAKIISFSDDSILVIIPSTEFGRYGITIKSKDRTYYSEKMFEVIDCQFQLTSFFPKSGCINSNVVLYGHKFKEDSIVSVSFNDINAEIESISDDSLIVIVPDLNYGKYDIKVKSKFGEITYDELFEVIDCQIQLSSFFPQFGATGYKVILYGKNFVKDSILEVYFNDIPSKIDFITNDSIGVTVPDISSGNVKIKVKSISKTIEFNDWFEVKLKSQDYDFSQIRSIYFSFNNLDVYFHVHSASGWFPDNSTNDYIDTLSDFSRGYKNTFSINYEKIGSFEYKLTENSYLIYSNTRFKVNEFDNYIDSINFDAKYTFSYDSYKQEWINYAVKLKGIQYRIDADSSVIIKFNNKFPRSSLLSLIYSEEGSYRNGHQSGSYRKWVEKILDFTDSSSVEILLSK
ncbi:MAG: hypothetical protein EPN82_01390 [Bacteroidetes bacterium]|nr:MAG: hypothetical protein EPN82_01390 [Bacteroidota bacterium]